MAMNNTRFSRQHNSREDRAAGLKEIKTVRDIWLRKSGTDDELTDLFIAMARAAGMKVYLMKVTSRASNIFSPALLALDQLDDNVAIVVLGGKEQFFDPGQRDCPFGQMAWIHSGVKGLRELDGGATAIASTPVDPFSLTQAQRIGDLTLADDGSVQGTLKITWMGQEALAWRQMALKADEEEMKRSMREWAEHQIPPGLNPEVTAVDNFEDYEKPLVVHFTVSGPLATVTAKRFILPGQFFESSAAALFPSPKRETPIWFHYGGQTLDAVRFKLPADLKVESTPASANLQLLKAAAYGEKSEVQPGVILMRRSYALVNIFFLPSDYADVRTFYNKVAAADQEPIVLLSGDSSGNR